MKSISTKAKDRIKMCLAVGTLAIIIIAVFIIVIQYQIEGEKNMPYTLSKITIVSTAEGEQETKDQENKWNLNVNQNNDVYFFIEGNNEENDNEDQELLESVTIQDIEITKVPTKGTVKIYMPNSETGRNFTYADEYLVKDSLTYKGGKTSNIKNLEIGSRGGSCVIRFSNTGIGNYISNDAEEITHNGSLITKLGVTEEEVSFTVNFNLILQINKIKYKANITLNLPCSNLTTEGTTTQEILNTEENKIVFKRVK